MSSSVFVKIFNSLYGTTHPTADDVFATSTRRKLDVAFNVAAIDAGVRTMGFLLVPTKWVPPEGTSLLHVPMHRHRNVGLVANSTFSEEQIRAFAARFSRPADARGHVEIGRLLGYLQPSDLADSTLNGVVSLSFGVSGRPPIVSNNFGPQRVNVKKIDNALLVRMQQTWAAFAKKIHPDAYVTVALEVHASLSTTAK